jgi:sugar/nucleoside kinase (ribokinase family)
VTDRTPELVAHVTMPVLAEHVPESLTGERDPERALRKLRRQHRGVICVTLGVHGSMALDGDHLIHVPAFPVHAVDTTGAGDVFRAGFVYGALAGWPTLEILRFANAAAAVSCTRLGAISAIPTRAEVEQLLRTARAQSLIPNHESLIAQSVNPESADSEIRGFVDPKIQG